jgi:putative ABC transport system permease protein
MITNGWRLAWRISAREARASAFKFLFVIFGVAAGVGALAGVRGFSEAFRDALMREARTLMAGDLTLRMFSTPTPKQEAALERWVNRGARLTRITETVSMMGVPGGVPALVSVKAVDPAAYPFYGEVKLDPPQKFREALKADAIAVSDDLLLRLDVQPGGKVKLGDAEFRVVGTVRVEPDRMTGSLNVGPRVMVTREGLERTGLMTFGSRASQRLLFKLPEQGVDITAMRNDLKNEFREALISDYRETHPLITRALNRATTFLSLISLIALVVGSLGVATAVHSHLQQRLDSIAIMKCLGASSGQIIKAYTLQTAMLGFAGGLAGLGVGAVVQRLFPLLLAKFLPTQNVGWSPAFALEGVAVGVLTSLLFTLPPLLAIRQIKPALIFRREMAESRPRWPERLRRQWSSIATGAVILGGLGAIAGWLAESWKMGWYFVGGLAASLLALAAIARLLLALLRTVVRMSPWRLPVEVRHGLANLYRPGNHAAAVLVSLGVGVTFTLSVYLIQKSLLGEVMSMAPPGSPNVFMINVTDREVEGFRSLLASWPGFKGRAAIDAFATVRMVAVDGQPLDDLQVPGSRRRFRQTRQVTWMEKQPEDAQILKGAWWKENSAAPALSVSDEAAERMGLAPGKVVRWWSGGREFDVPVVAVHRMKSVRFGPPLDFLFNRAALAGLPVQYFGAVRMAPPQVPAFQREAYKRFPTVTVINAADVLSIVQEVVDQVSLLVRFISAFAILAGAIILAATVAGTRFRRIRETAVLKTLGARRFRLAGIFSVEFSVLGLTAGVMGSILATAFSRVLMVRLLDAEFRFDWLPNLFAVAATTLLAVGSGWLASLRVLGQKPLEVLRDE